MDSISRNDVTNFTKGKEYSKDTLNTLRNFNSELSQISDDQFDLLFNSCDLDGNEKITQVEAESFFDALNEIENEDCGITDEDPSNPSIATSYIMDNLNDDKDSPLNKANSKAKASLGLKEDE